MNFDFVKFYENESSTLDSISSNQDFFQTLLLTLFLLALIIILYTRMFFSVEFENWEIQKCNPKYIFYSGYIKQNENSGSLQSTVDNFNDCIVRFNNQKDNQFSKVLEKKQSQHLRRNREIVESHNKLSRQKVLELQEKVNSKNEEFRLQLENIKSSRQTSELQTEMNKLNDIIRDIKDYAHSYLTYAMMHFVFKHKISEKDGTSKTLLNSNISCGTYTDESQCNSDLYCIYDGDTCRNINKGEFYKQEANSLNETIKQYFGNNKL
jgi:hypothetical protein